MKRRTTAFLLLLLMHLNLSAQNFIGLSSSNYSGIHGTLMNPANAADSRYKVYVNIGAVGADLQNNLLRWKAPYSILALSTKTVNPKYNAPSGLPEWKSSYYGFNSLANTSKLFFNAEIRGPAIQINFPRWGAGIAGGVRYRVFSSFTKTSPTIIQTIATGTKNPLLQNVDNTGIHGIMNFSGVNEIYASISKVLREDSRNFLKVGATAKRLTSNLNLSVNADELDYNITPNTGNSSQDVNVQRARGTFFHAAETSGAFNIGWIATQMTQLKAIGNGFGADIGFVYEYRPNYTRERYKYKNQFIPDPEVNKYKYKFGAALTDIGFLTYSHFTDVQVGTVETANVTIEPATFYKLGSTNEFIADVEQVFTPDQANYGRSFRVLMPAKLILHGDYLVREGFYVSGVLRQALLGKSRLGPIGYSGLSVIPRFEKKYVEFAFPLTLDNDYTNLNLGATMRAGPLFLGFDNITGWINTFNPRGLSVHAGLFWGFNHRRPGNSLLDCFFEPKAKSKKKKGLFSKRSKN
ncbi:MAG: DUF5723 family protein [Cytophagales bacterium]|nr:DUF5723 family protein [Cytophagales bacterium]